MKNIEVPVLFNPHRNILETMNKKLKRQREGADDGNKKRRKLKHHDSMDLIDDDVSSTSLNEVTRSYYGGRSSYGYNNLCSPSWGLNMIDDFQMSRLIQWFEKYCDSCNSSQSNVIRGHLYNRMRTDMGFKTLFNIQFLLWMYTMRSTNRDELKRGEWINGMYSIQSDTPVKLKIKLEQMEMEFRYVWKAEEVKSFYGFVFDYFRDDPCRSLPIPLGINLIRMLGAGKKFTNQFCKFLQNQENQWRCLNRDQFKMFVDFNGSIRGDLSNYSSHDAWPIIYDHFVLWWSSSRNLFP